MAEKTEYTDATISGTSEKPEETPPQHVPDFFKNAPDTLHNRVVGFGKHKMLTFQQLATDQKKYINWLFSQTWFNSRYPELYEYLELVGLGPEKTHTLHLKEDVDDITQLCGVQTHNQLQARFTNNEQLLELVKKVLGHDKHEYNIRSVTFEHWCGADIEVLVTQITPIPGMLMNSSTVVNHTLLFELKPSVSDDYPDVLRQIRGQLYSHGIFRKQTGVLDDKITQVLVTQRYDGTTPLEKVKSMYGNVQIVFVV
uniref:Uncharacterized protein n=1 Tax=Marseillevirus LCMAC101 TaxID=2506602 RepID=A0A481YQP1_9VIRU|nr:MAG: hypothetical protein LCMAC101_01180 [Marseillevirus LCMAC101]